MRSNIGMCKQNLLDDDILRSLDELGDVKQKSETQLEETWENDNPIKENLDQKKRPPVNKVDYNCLDTQNPYFSESKVDLHIERKNGWRWIETSVLMEIVKSKLSGSELKLFLYILHRTRGYCNKKNGFHNLTKEIPLREMVNDTGMSRTTIYRSLEGLLDKKMIYQVTDERTGNTKIGNNFRYDTWDTES